MELKRLSQPQLLFSLFIKDGKGPLKKGGGKGLQGLELANPKL